MLGSSYEYFFPTPRSLTCQGQCGQPLKWIHNCLEKIPGGPEASYVPCSPLPIVFPYKPVTAIVSDARQSNSTYSGTYKTPFGALSIDKRALETLWRRPCRSQMIVVGSFVSRAWSNQIPRNRFPRKVRNIQPKFWPLAMNIPNIIHYLGKCY